MKSLADASLSDVERRAVEHVAAALRHELGSDLYALWLYGSRARGEQPHLDSDVDLLVITRGGRKRDFDRVTELVMDAVEAEGLNIFCVSTMVADPDWIESRRSIESFFIREVDRDKIVLAGQL